MDNKTGQFKESKFYDAPAQVRDMIAGFLYLRNMDLSKLKLQDTVVVTGFFEDEFYKMKIVYHGKQTIGSRPVKSGLSCLNLLCRRIKCLMARIP